MPPRTMVTKISLICIATLCYFCHQAYASVDNLQHGNLEPNFFNLRNLKWNDGDSEASAVFKHGLNLESTFRNGSGGTNDRGMLGDKDENDDAVECREVKSRNKTEKCSFVESTDDCQIDEGLVDYTNFAYCSFDPDAIAVPLIILAVWWLYLIVGIAVAAEDFFCPALTVIAKTLHLSQNIAGVTVLAFGNGAPDIFSAIAAIGNLKNGDAGLAIGSLFGAGVFVTTVVAGIIAVICPFDAMQRPFLRDIVFYLAATFWTFYVLWDKEITQLEAIGFILLYVFYVIVVVVGRYIYRRQKNCSKPLSGTTVYSNDGKLQTTPGDDQKNEEDRIVIESARGIIQNSGDEEKDEEDNIIIDRSRETQPLLRQDNDKTPFQEFMSAINPVSKEKWARMNLARKIYQGIKSPLLFFLIITIPKVDYDEKNHNWNRYLNTLQCVTGLVFGAFVTKVGFNTMGPIPVWTFLLVIGVILATVVFFTSKNDERPIYHAAFAYLGFVIAVVWIYSIANEIVNILQTFGIVFNISNAILGLTLLAWGNSTGDLVPDIAMARKGYPRTAISGCFGGTFFNLLLGIGIPFAIGSMQKGTSYKLQITVEEVVLAGFLTLSLITSLIVVPLSNFRLSRPYGIMLFVLYAVFLVVAILAETGAISGNIDP